MGADLIQYAWLIPLFPLLAFLLLISLGRQNRSTGSLISITAAAASFVVTVSLAIGRLTDNAVDYVWNDFVWLTFSKSEIRMGYEITNLNVLMLLVVTLVSLLVNVYAQSYMKNDDRYNVFFAYTSLFSFSMIALVMSPNLIQMYIFWELVGVCSFLLIGFWYTKPEAKKAAKKAFIVTRIGDVGLLIAILLLYWKLPGLDFSSIHNAMQTGELTGWLVTLIAILIFVGAIGKSGQFPLHTWLPDAMVGPTPISALIHAATMVAAGVFLVAKTYPIFEASSVALMVVSIVGIITVLLGATIAIVQTDIKRILAYSTMSQLGYMMLALGMGTTLGYAAGIFHLFTHAFFKALLFLAAGSVIVALKRQNIWEMGGLSRSMKWTTWTFGIGALALSGVFPLSGFWSKEAILAEVYDVQPILFWLALVGVFLTAFYMGKMFFLVFTGEKRHEEHVVESPHVMTVPLIVLAVLAVISGFVLLPNAPWLAEWLTGEKLGGQANILLIVLSNVVALVGIGAAWFRYHQQPVDLKALSKPPSALHKLVYKGYYIDDLVHYGIVIPMRVIGHLLTLADRYVISGAVNVVSSTVVMIGNVSRRLQNGQIQNYGLIALVGVTILIVVMVGRRFF